MRQTMKQVHAVQWSHLLKILLQLSYGTFKGAEKPGHTEGSCYEHFLNLKSKLSKNEKATLPFT